MVIKSYGWIDSNPPTPLPAIGQTPIRNSDKQRLAFRTGTDSECWRMVLLWQVSARDDNRYRGKGTTAMCLVPIYRGP
jgi:hypothetical protein